MRTLIRRNLPPPITVRPDPGVVPADQSFWDDPKGMDYQNPPSKIDMQHASEITNFVVELGQTFSRAGTRLIGPAGTGVMAVVRFISLSGREHMLRFRQTGVDRYTPTPSAAAFQTNSFEADTFQGALSNNWYAVAGTYSLSGTADDRFCFTTFGNTLLFSNGRQGIFEYDPDNERITLIAGSYPCRFMTTFGGRVVASSVRDPNRQANRIRWSVKDNSHDWSGDGSGFDDLLDTPGGQVDEQMGVFPQSETRALAVRGSTTWLMQLTGYVLAPFRFSRLYDEIGTRSPYAIVPVPNGVLLIGRDDVYTINDQGITLYGSGIKPVGTLVIKRIRDAADDVQKLTGAYDEKHRRVLISSIESGQCVMYCYSLISNTWSRRKYPYLINCVAHVRAAKPGLRIKDLTGTVAQLTGAIEDLGGSTYDSDGVVFSDPSYVHMEDETQTDDETSPGVIVNSTLEASTGVAHAGSPLEQTEVLEVQIELIALKSQTLTVNYSVDGGTSWQLYGTALVTATTKTQVIRIMKRIVANKIQMQLTGTTLGSLTLIRFAPSVVKGGRIIAA